MKKETISTAVLLLLLAGQVQAQSCASANAQPAAENGEMTEAEAVKALEALAKTGVIVIDQQTHKIKLRQDLIDKLESEGKLQQTYSSVGSICL